MTRKVHTPPDGSESPKAAEAFRQYRDMGPGRSLEKLCDLYKEQERRHKQDASVPLPPSTNLDTIKGWSARWNWVARVAVWESEADYARRQEQIRQIERQAAENTKLLQQVGSGALAVVAVALNKYVHPQTGELQEHIPPRDLPGLMKAGAELLQLSVGSPTQILGTADSTQMERILRESPDEVRTAVLTGMRAALKWQEEHGG